jgi:hypothetical protein
MLGSITEGFKEPLYAVRETAVHSGEPMLERMGHTIGKMMGGHFGKTNWLKFSNARGDKFGKIRENCVWSN